MKDGFEAFKAKEYFDELQRVASNLSHEGIDRIVDTLMKVY